ncbi:hypothetical protein [Psychrobacillus lasiicapitis]|uniref:Uncharacterized protein n=1 Tax=Psychrobacillus lasiicapitis TaxID=1636719 RepID=A0A544SRK1_9BACI|nr:hypothetical protein [Psychrobacillus lasiicapitis]TQR07803.1 hypothetical protein FG382_22065 [Psychrobacillus lasiicapitis]GGA48802.1 hypothetical protein GCM10011384_43120 [Psychrobacillus lasiicapitis]
MHILDCLEPIDTPRVLNDMMLCAILYPLCKHNDIVSYQKALKGYKDSLREVLPKMMKIAKSAMKLKEEHLPLDIFALKYIAGNMLFNKRVLYFKKE